MSTPEAIKRAKAAYRERNRETLREKNRAYRRDNPEQARESGRKWKAAHKEQHGEYCNRWWREHPEKRREKQAKRRERIALSGGSFTSADWQEIVRRQNGQCASCMRIAQLTVDHIVAIARGGRHDKENIQGLCGPCNSRKGAGTAASLKETA